MANKFPYTTQIKHTNMFMNAVVNGLEIEQIISALYYMISTIIWIQIRIYTGSAKTMSK